MCGPLSLTLGLQCSEEMSRVKLQCMFTSTNTPLTESHQVHVQATTRGYCSWRTLEPSRSTGCQTPWTVGSNSLHYGTFCGRSDLTHPLFQFFNYFTYLNSIQLTCDFVILTTAWRHSSPFMKSFKLAKFASHMANRVKYVACSESVGKWSKYVLPDHYRPTLLRTQIVLIHGHWSASAAAGCVTLYQTSQSWCLFRNVPD